MGTIIGRKIKYWRTVREWTETNVEKLFHVARDSYA